jgi:RNA-directed DNA polymerase
MNSSTLSNKAKSFLSIKDREQLADWIGVTDLRLRYITYRLTSSQKYRSFEIPKRKGGSRKIQAPIESLMSIQRRFLSVFQEIAPASQLAKGYVPGLSIFDHANRHKSRRWVVLADLSDFFPSINFGRVRAAFMSPPFQLPSSVATIVAQLCCNDGVLPQGAPTSPVISNLICKQLDRRLLNLSRKYRLTVTRYADDICFSTNLSVVPDAIAVSDGFGGYRPGSDLVETVRESGFFINETKFKVFERRDQKMVTGLIVNNGVSTPRKWRRQMRVVMSLLERYSDKKATEIVSDWSRPVSRRPKIESLEKIARGKIGHAHWIDEKASRDFVRSLFRGYPSLRGLLPRLGPSIPFRVMSEGPTDLNHLKAAFDYFHAKGAFLELQPKLLNFRGDTNDSSLWASLQKVANVGIDALVVGIFDCDAHDFLKKNGLEPGEYTRLHRNVYAVCLAPPFEMTVNDEYCIESLYRREEAIHADDQGRRLFFRDEFDENGLHVSKLYKREFPKKKSIVLSEKVTRIADGASVAMSKMDFSDLVEGRKVPFQEISFDGFLPTFQLIRKLVEEYELSNH